MTTPKMKFDGGPLDGQTVEKSKPGRWPAVVGADGEAMRSHEVGRKTALGESDFYRMGEPVPTTDGSLTKQYVWGK